MVAAPGGPGDVVVDGAGPVQLAPHIQQHPVAAPYGAGDLFGGLVVGVRRVGVAPHDGAVGGTHAGLGEALDDEFLDLDFLQRDAVARTFANELEGGGAHPVGAAAGLHVGFQRLGRPARLEVLDQLGGADHLEAHATHQLDGAAIHVGNVGDGAQRRVLHGHPPASAGDLAQGLDLLAPA